MNIKELHELREKFIQDKFKEFSKISFDQKSPDAFIEYEGKRISQEEFVNIKLKTFIQQIV